MSGVEGSVFSAFRGSDYWFGGVGFIEWERLESKTQAASAMRPWLRRLSNRRFRSGSTEVLLVSILESKGIAL